MTPDQPADDAADTVAPGTPARPLRRMKPEDAPSPRAPHSAAAPALLLVAALSGLCGVVLTLMGFGGNDALILIGIQGVIAAVTLFASAAVVHGVEEIAYWTRRTAELLERQNH